MESDVGEQKTSAEQVYDFAKIPLQALGEATPTAPLVGQEEGLEM
jgi:hypothetical protein